MGDNHQDSNAEMFERAGASVVLKVENAVVEKAAPLLFDLLNNPARLGRMARKAKDIARVNASSEIVENIKNKISQ